MTANGGGGSTLSGTIALAPEGRAAPMGVATITSSLSGNDVTVTGGPIIMGANEAMTILGNLTMNSSSYAALGDLVASGAVNVTSSSTSPNNFFISRANATLQTSTGGSVLSPVGHFLGGGNNPSILSAFTPTGPIKHANVPALVGGALLSLGTTILNYDDPSIPIIPGGCPPCPPCPPIPTRNFPPRPFFPYTMSVASAGQLNNLFVADDWIPYVFKEILWGGGCSYAPIIFLP